MSRYVVDASVAVKWYLPEIHDVQAQRLLSNGHDLLVPDLLFSEVGNILWKRVRTEQMTDVEAQTVLQSLGGLPLRVVPSWPLALLALEIACQTDRTVYDNHYLALAVQEQEVLVTADARFFNAIQSTPLASQILWVEDIP